MSAPVSLLVNQIHSSNHWIAFKSIGKESNRDRIGARIRAKAGARIFVDEVRSGSSYDSNNDMRVHFGRGAVGKLELVEVRWPSGLTEKFATVRLDAVNPLTEGSGEPEKSVK
jgi:hypothetical protein